MPVNGLANIMLADGEDILQCEDIIFHPHPEMLKQYIPAEDLIIRIGSEEWKRIGDIKIRI